MRSGRLGYVSAAAATAGMPPSNITISALRAPRKAFACITALPEMCLVAHIVAEIARETEEVYRGAAAQHAGYPSYNCALRSTRTKTSMKKTSTRAKSGWPVCVAAGPFLFFSGQLGHKAGRNAGAGALCTSFADVAGQGPRQASGAAWVDRLEGPVGAQGIAIYEQYRALLK